MNTYNIEMAQLTYKILEYMAKKYCCSIGDLISESVREYYAEETWLYVNTKYKYGDDK